MLNSPQNLWPISPTSRKLYRSSRTKTWNVSRVQLWLFYGVPQYGLPCLLPTTKSRCNSLTALDITPSTPPRRSLHEDQAKVLLPTLERASDHTRPLCRCCVPQSGRRIILWNYISGPSPQWYTAANAAPPITRGRTTSSYISRTRILGASIC